jgi:hypothetical protein
MSIQVQSCVWEHSKQKYSSLLLLLAIADFADDKGRAFPAVETLAQKARVTERQAHRIIKQLEADGEISIAINQGPRGCNLYTVKLSGVTNCQGDNKNTKGVTFVAEIVSEMSPEPSLEPPIEPPVKTKGKLTPLPVGFETPEAPQDIAQAFTSQEIAEETRQFKDHAQANGKKHVDWDSAWRYWMRNAIKFRSQRQSRRHERPPKKHSDNPLSEDFDFQQSAFTVNDFMVGWDLTREEAEKRWNAYFGTAKAA